MAIKPRIGLFGGSFDPVHKAHIALCLAAIDSLKLDQLQLIPANQPWQKSQLSCSSAQRLAMLQISIKNHAKIMINTSEIERQGNTYTIDTVRFLPQPAEYFWIMGSDQLINFCTWHAWQDIIKHVQLAVALRPGSSLNPPAELQQQLNKQIIHEIPFTPMDISSTLVRQSIQQNLDLTAILDPDVINYIKANQLYQYTDNT